MERPGAPCASGLAWTLSMVLLLAVSAACGGQDLGPVASALAPERDLWARVVQAEDARGGGDEGLQPLRDGLEASTPAVRAVAVRAVGRLERPDLLDLAVGRLSDGDAGVRSAAAGAVAQALIRGDGSDRLEAARALLDALESESEPGPKGALASALGRVLAPPAGRGGGAGRGRGGGSGGDPAAEELRADAALRFAELAIDPDPDARLGAALGLRSLGPSVATPGSTAEAVQTALDSLLAIPARGNSRLRRGPEGFAPDPQARARRVAVSVFVAAFPLDTLRLWSWLFDPDRLLRREAVAGVGRLADPGPRTRLLGRALDDPSPEVRFEALGLSVRGPNPECGPAIALARDPAPPVLLPALDRLASCRPAGLAIAALDSVARTLGPVLWPAPARALAALAQRDPEAAEAILPPFVTHGNPVARSYAARAATTLADLEALSELARDPDPNVQAAALDGLYEHLGSAADSFSLAALRPRPLGVDGDHPHRLDPAPQVAMAAASGLAGSSTPGVADALLDALDRLTEARSESSVDARLALLDAAGRTGNAASAGRIRPYLADFEARIATRAEEVLFDLTGVREAAAPRPLPPSELPTFDELAALEGAHVVLDVEGVGELAILLHPFEAPTNVARFANLARTGALDDLTIHRVVPNFVLQGGSPDANEYAGYDRFTRDELGSLRNWWATVGLSTRGHDTGDGQFYINVVDNLRLDHQYTVFGTVERGRELLHLITEGAVIRARLESR